MKAASVIQCILVVLGVLIGGAYLRCFIKRILCMAAIRRVCRRGGFAVKVPFLWFLGSRYAKRCDCVIDTPQALFAVKLFGCLWPLKSLIFREYGDYFFRAHANFLSFLLDPLDNTRHPLPEYRFPQAEGKAVRPVLLINPMPVEILLQPCSGMESTLGPGDQLFGMELASISHLTRIVENAGQP